MWAFFLLPGPLALLQTFRALLGPRVLLRHSTLARLLFDLASYGSGLLLPLIMHIAFDQAQLMPIIIMYCLMLISLGNCNLPRIIANARG